MAAAPAKKGRAPKIIGIVAAVFVAFLVAVGMASGGSSGSGTSGSGSSPSSASSFDGYWMVSGEGAYGQCLIDGEDIHVWVGGSSVGEEQSVTGSFSPDDGSFRLSDGEEGTISASGDDMSVTFSDSASPTALSRASVFHYDGDDMTVVIWIAGSDVIMTTETASGDYLTDNGTISSDGTISYYSGQTGLISSDGNSYTYEDTYGTQGIELEQIA